ncbi:MAG: HAD hydrolase-like protein [Desulfotignum sp.]|jgi:HAD superfamily hydrolase (TIGR01450 family)|nr:HAD hydrolase-like protein [Desulfotignum sp.]
MVLTTEIIPTLQEWLWVNLAALDALVFDIDGVLLVNGGPAPGSRALLDMLRKKQVPFFLLTNDGDHSTEEKAQILNAADLQIHYTEIVSCGDGLVTLHAEKKFSPAPFFIMGNLGNPCFAQKAGLHTTRNLSQIHHCQGVIVGEKDYDWEITINAVVNFFIQKPDALLIVPNPDEYYPGKIPGHICIGAGGVARFIARVLKNYGISVSPIYLGKPFSPIFQKTHAQLESFYGRPVSRNRVLMTGDFLLSDIQGALDFGYLSALVLTGVTTADMLERSKVSPDLVFETLG